MVEELTQSIDAVNFNKYANTIGAISGAINVFIIGKK